MRRIVKRMHALAVWTIAALAIAAMLVRPWRTTEWIWPLAGAVLLTAAGLLPAGQAAAAARDGSEVYAFLFGMLALAELASVHGIFAWIGGMLVRRTGASAPVLFLWLFGIAVVVTAFLSNDGTIVLLTPVAVELARAARVRVAPFAYAVAFVANAASFILPFSNPANLVVFSPLPALLPWLERFIVPSAAALACTYAILRLRYRRDLHRSSAEIPAPSVLGPNARIILAVVCCSLAVLVAAAAFGWPVGYVALGVGSVSLLIAAMRDPAAALRTCRQAPWQVIPLVAGLFVIVRALDRTGVLSAAHALLARASLMPPVEGRLYAGAAVTFADALINNLPVSVIARYALHGAGVTPSVAHAALVGVDLGPNLSISGSLATLLWLMLLRREGVRINAWRFLGLGALITIPSLAAALLTLG